MRPCIKICQFTKRRNFFDDRKLSELIRKIRLQQPGCQKHQIIQHVSALIGKGVCPPLDLLVRLSLICVRGIETIKHLSG